MREFWPFLVLGLGTQWIVNDALYQNMDVYMSKLPEGLELPNSAGSLGGGLGAGFMLLVWSAITACGCLSYRTYEVVAWAQAMQKSVVESMAGFYLLRALGPCEEQGRLTLSDKASADAIMVHETCFAPTLEVSCTVNLNGSTTLVLVPAMYAVGQQGPFEIELASDQPVRWSALG